MRRTRTTNKSQRRSKRLSSRPKEGSDDEDNDLPAACRCHICQMRKRKKNEEEDLEEMSRKLTLVFINIERRIDDSLEQLDELIRIKSISTLPEFHTETLKVLDIVAEKLVKLNFSVNDVYVGAPRPIDPKPPQQKILFASYFSSPMRSTLLIYTYLDVLDADPNEGWLSNPFELIMNEGVLYGRGLKNGKAPTMCWLNAIEAWLAADNDLPLNVKFIIEAMHQVGSLGLDAHIESRKEFFADVDYIVFHTNSWLNNEQPVISCSLAGWAHYGIELSGGNKTLNSGQAGGLVYEPMNELSHLMNSLMDNDHHIKVPFIENERQSLTAGDWELLETAQFSEYEYKDHLDVRRLKNDISKVEMLKYRWCKSSLSIHGVEGSFSFPGWQLALPLRVMGKISFKLVPNQSVGSVSMTLQDYLRAKYDHFQMHSTLAIHHLDSSMPYSWPPTAKHLLAVTRAVQKVFKVEPSLTVGICTCMPIANVFCRLTTGKNIILLPFGRRTDRNNEVNESITEKLYVRNSKVCAALFQELAQLPARCKCDVIFDYCSRRGVAEFLQAEQGAVKLTAPESKVGPMSKLTSKVKPKKEKMKETSFADLHKEERPRGENRIKQFLCWPLKRQKKKG